MRDVVYSVAMSLDGYIAGPLGEYDWIPQEPQIDWGQFVGRFDTALLGRKSYEVLKAAETVLGTLDLVVFTRDQSWAAEAGRKAEATPGTAAPGGDAPSVRFVTDSAADTVQDLRRLGGKDIWLFGGGSLFRDMLAAGVVTRIEVAVVPFLLGGGIPLLPAPAPSKPLKLRSHRSYPSGIQLIEYDVPDSKP